MSSPDLSALVPAHTRVRLTYALSWEIISLGEPQALVDLLNQAWQDYALAVVYQPAVAPTPAPGTVLGSWSNGYTTLDVLTGENLPTITWDQWLAPMRSVTSFNPVTFLDACALNQVDLVAAAGTPAGSSASVAAANTAASATAAQQAATNPTDPVSSFVNGVHNFLTGAQGYLGLALALGLTVLALIYGPELVGIIVHPKKKES